MTLNRLNLLLILLALLSGWPSLGAAAATNLYPQTRDGKLVADWMSLCTSANLTDMTTWMTAHLSSEGAKRKSAATRAGEAFELCHVNGPFHVQRVQASGNSYSLLAVGRRTHLWYTLQYIFDEAGQLDRMGDDPAMPPEMALPKKLTDAITARAIEDEAVRLTNAGLFSGIVVVARGDETIATYSGGYADRTSQSLITPDTQFTIGSVAKMFTAVAVGQLVDQKKLSFSDKVARFFPDYPNAAVRDQVTVGMLLSHTSGLDDFLSKRPAAMMRGGATKAEEFLPLFAKDELQFPPGSSWSYSNAGLALAGAIVERVSGENYSDYVRRHIFDVAGMTNSEPNNIPRSHTHLVTPYTRGMEPPKSSDWRVADADIGSPAGGAISTAKDLLRFVHALRNGSLLSRETFDVMCTPDSHSPQEYRYGYGMEIEPLFGEIAVGHSGGFPGVSAELHFLRGSPYAMVVLSNQDPPSASYIGSWALALIAERAKLEKRPNQ